MTKFSSLIDRLTGKAVIVLAAAILSAAGCATDPDGTGSRGFAISKPDKPTTEGGGQVSIMMALTSRPSSNVTVKFDSDNTAEGTVSVKTLTFTPDNWNAPQAIMVTGVDDTVADGPVEYRIVFEPAVSTDSEYSGMTPPAVLMVNIDDETAGIRYADVSGPTTESGGKATFTVVLNAPPSADVNIALASDREDEGIVETTSLVFTPANWNAPQTVTVAGIDDDKADGEQPYNIVMTVTSQDKTYAAVVPPDVPMSNADNDTAGLTTSVTDDRTSESGEQGSFTVKLNTRPLDTVVVNVLSSDATEGTATPAKLTFTVDNWNAPQQVMVTGVNDDVADGNQIFAVVLTMTGGDDRYTKLDPVNVPMTNTDDETPGVTVGTVSGNTGENGGQATFTIKLNSEPTADVEIKFDSNDKTEGTVAMNSIKFTKLNWNAPVEVIITGIDDETADGNQPYAIVFETIVSEDAAYAAIAIPNVNLSNIDNDQVGVTLGKKTGNTAENGTQASFTIVLNTKPTADVVIEFESSDTTEGLTDRTALTFTPDNWNAPQVINVTGVNDEEADGDQVYAVTFTSVSSDDSGYDELDIPDVEFTNVDDDSPGINVSVTDVTTTEFGGSIEIQVSLHSRPTANVTIGFSSSDETEGTVTAAALTFTPDNWNSIQKIIVTGEDDDLADGAQPYRIQFTASTSADELYAGITPASVELSNTDNDSAGVEVEIIDDAAGENGEQGSFRIRLNSQPYFDVRFEMEVDSPDEAELPVASVTFTPQNWHSFQTVNVNGVNDDVDDGNQTFVVRFKLIVTEDSAYSVMYPSNVVMTCVDDDTAGFTVTPPENDVDESGTQATFSVVLNSKPLAPVTVNFEVSDSSEASTGTETLTFTEENWNAPQYVVVTGRNDDVMDGTQQFSIDFYETVSDDPAYAAIIPADFGMSNADDDSAGIKVSKPSGNTREDGTQATFTVVLTSEPTADVTVYVTSMNPAEGAVDSDHLTFTAENWNAPQTVTVIGVDDDMMDGAIEYFVRLYPVNSDDPNYAGMPLDQVKVVNDDDDTANIIVKQLSDTTSEIGYEAQFTVRLSSKPYAPVTVRFDPSDNTEAVADFAELTFDEQNWDAPRTVSVRGLNDDLADGNQNFRVRFHRNETNDPAYEQIIPGDLYFVNLDDDTAGITVSGSSNGTTEEGLYASFTVRLNSQPFNDVYVNFATTDTTEGVTNVTSLKFTAANWNSGQEVLVFGQDDYMMDGDQIYFVRFTETTSDDPGYAGLTPQNLQLINYDNDTAGVEVINGTANTTEPGGVAQVWVRLRSEPTGFVIMRAESSDPTEGTAFPSEIVFTPSDWSIYREITITGVDDDYDDGDQQYRLDFGFLLSADPNYDHMIVHPVDLVNRDEDSSGFNVDTEDTISTEAGDAAVIKVWLKTKPFADVTVNYHSSDTTEGTVGPTSITFTDQNWSVPQEITVTGVDDVLDDGDQLFDLVFDATVSMDSRYGDIKPSTVNVLNKDDDSTGYEISAISGHTTENGGSATFKIRLTSKPTSDVSIMYTTSDATEGRVVPIMALPNRGPGPVLRGINPRVTFTPDNWNVDQTITVWGVDDTIVDGAQTWYVNFYAPTTTDPTYQFATPNSVEVVNDDNDTPGFVMGQVAGHTNENGGSTTFTIRLKSQPTANVRLSYYPNDPSEGRTTAPLQATEMDEAAGGGLYSYVDFTSENWYQDQTITVWGSYDYEDDGDQTWYVVFMPASTTDPVYSGLTPDSVAVVNDDVDTAGLTVNTTVGSTSETNAFSFTVRLNSRPTGAVTLYPASTDTTEGQIRAGYTTVTFDATNWSTPQTVYVDGYQDNLIDGTQYYSVWGNAYSSDPMYNGVTMPVISMTSYDSGIEPHCINLGWKQGNASWGCPGGYRMPTTAEWSKVEPCITASDYGILNTSHDVAVSVGGCNCKWNADYCGLPSIETIREGRMCGDYTQLHICVY